MPPKSESFYLFIYILKQTSVYQDGHILYILLDLNIRLHLITSK